MKFKYCIIFILLINYSFAQKEASYWYFGFNAGIDFSSGSPVALNNGSLFTVEGCASISDANGNLLFYTDGTRVWNKNHNQMPAGTNLYGNSSSSQSAIIVPKPGAPEIYFIFTVDWSAGEFGLNYYTVDMNLDNGLGDVISTNNIPTVNNLLSSPTSEKITAVKVLNEEAYWVISLKNGRFYVFKIDNNGVNSVPVSGNDGYAISEDVRGYLKVSPDGTKLVSANMSSGTYLYDFDSSTGLITNEREVDLSGAFGYGVEFSPSSKKLYVSTGNYDIEGNPAEEKLFQFNLDIDDVSQENINSTRIELHSYINQRAALQLGPDGKIYRAIDEQAYLGVINFPENIGTATFYQHNAISLDGRLSGQGLPPFIQSFFVADINVQHVCYTDETTFSINSNEPVLAVLWDFGDGSAASTELSPIHVYNDPGDYVVTLEITTEDEIKEITHPITIFDLPDINQSIELQQCDDNTDGITIFNLTEAEKLITSEDTFLDFSYFLSYEDAVESTNEIINIYQFSNEEASQVFVRVENEFGCYSIATIELKVSTTVIPTDFTLTFYQCDNETNEELSDGIATFNFSTATNNFLDLFPQDQELNITYFESIDDALIEQNPIDPNNYTNDTSPFSQQLVVRIEDLRNNSCIGLGAHINLVVNSNPEFDIEPVQYICLNELPQPVTTLTVQDPKDDYSYTWRDQNNNILNSESVSQIEVYSAGDYYVTATSKDNCMTSKKITVIESNEATVLDFIIKDDSENNSIMIQVEGVGDYEFALDNEVGPYQTESLFENVEAGLHNIFIRDKNGCGIVSEQVSVIGYPRFFTPNGDGYNDRWRVLGIEVQPNSKVYIFDRFGKVLAKLTGNNDGWDGLYNGSLLPASDYWFLVELEDGRTRRGHFSLIRK